MEEIPNVPVTKTFNVEFTQPMNFKDAQTSNRIELVKTGSIAVPVTLKQTSAYSIEVIPTKKLASGGTYTLVIHPGSPSAKNRTVKQGIFVPITVQPGK